MAEQDNIRTAEQVFPLMFQGKIDELLALFTPDAVWSEPGPSDILPLAGSFGGEGGLRGFFDTMVQQGTEPIGEPRTPVYVAQGDRVAVFGHRGARVTATGKTWEDDWVLLYVFEGDKIKSVQAFNDTAARVAAYTP